MEKFMDYVAAEYGELGVTVMMFTVVILACVTLVLTK